MSITEGNQDRHSHRAGTWRQELIQGPWRGAAYWLAPWGLFSLLSFLSKDLFIYLFYVYEYTIVVQMVVSHHVVAGNWTQDLCSLRPCSLLPKDLFMQVHCSCLLDTLEKGIISHYGWLWTTMWLLGFELRTFGRAVRALNFEPSLQPTACFLIEPRTTAQGGPTHNEQSRTPSITKKILYRLATCWILGRHPPPPSPPPPPPPGWGSFLSDDFSLCQADRKLASTITVYLLLGCLSLSFWFRVLSSISEWTQQTLVFSQSHDISVSICHCHPLYMGDQSRDWDMVGTPLTLGYNPGLDFESEGLLCYLGSPSAQDCLSLVLDC
jgi:hypothetical protein